VTDERSARSSAGDSHVPGDLDLGVMAQPRDDRIPRVDVRAPRRCSSIGCEPSDRDGRSVRGRGMSGSTGSSDGWSARGAVGKSTTGESFTSSRNSETVFQAISGESIMSRPARASSSTAASHCSRGSGKLPKTLSGPGPEPCLLAVRRLPSGRPSSERLRPRQAASYAETASSRATRCCSAHDSAGSSQASGSASTSPTRQRTSFGR
jgi:hypothetical protein